MDNCTFQTYTEQDITLTNFGEVNKGMFAFFLWDTARVPAKQKPEVEVWNVCIEVKNVITMIRFHITFVFVNLFYIKTVVLLQIIYMNSSS